MNIAIIGVGKWGKNLLAEFSKQANVAVAIHKGSPETTGFLKDAYPLIEQSDSLDHALNDASIEAVVIATPTDTHFELARAALERGKHVFVEKPGSAKSAMLSQLCDEAESRGLVLAVGYEFAHHPALKKVKELFPEGDIKHIETEWHKWGTFKDHAVPHLLSHEISILKSLGAHKFSCTQSSMTRVISESDIVKADFDCGQFTASCSINRVSRDKKKTITVIGEGLTLIWNNNELFRIDADSEAAVAIDIDASSPVSIEAADFISAIENGRKPLVDGRFALEVYKTIDSLLV